MAVKRITSRNSAKRRKKAFSDAKAPGYPRVRGDPRRIPHPAELRRDFGMTSLNE
jgi:hypothetical protein